MVAGTFLFGLRGDLDRQPLEFFLQLLLLAEDVGVELFQLALLGRET